MSKVVEQETVVDESEEVVEVTEEAVVETAPEFKIPEKFEGKSVEDIVKSYQELEKAFGRSNNELGETRRINQQLMELQLNEKPVETEDVPRETLDVDSLLDNPSEALSKAIENNPRLKHLEEKLIQDERGKAKSSFESRHPDWQEVASSEDFQKWIQGSQNRMALFQKAHTEFDYGLAGELFDWYGQVHQPQKMEEARIDKATTETGGAKVPKRTKIFKKSDLEKMRMYDRDKFDSMQAEIIRAYAEGRVR